MIKRLTIKEIERYHRKYAPNDKVYELVYGHCQIVAEIALWCAGNIQKDIFVDIELLRSAALLHDIGTYILFNDDGKVVNERLYPQHAILGAKIIYDEGLDQRISDLVSTHILMGLSKEEVIATNWSLPEHNYEPQSIEGEILCYADRFHSKHPTFNDYDTFLDRLKKSLPIQAEKFELSSERFGIPDTKSLALKYKQPIR